MKRRISIKKYTLTVLYLSDCILSALSTVLHPSSAVHAEKKTLLAMDFWSNFDYKCMCGTVCVCVCERDIESPVEDDEDVLRVREYKANTRMKE